MKEQGTEQLILSAEETQRTTLPLTSKYKISNAIFGFAGSETSIPLFKGKEYKGESLLYTCRDFVCGKPETFPLT